MVVLAALIGLLIGPLLAQLSRVLATRHSLRSVDAWRTLLAGCGFDRLAVGCGLAAASVFGLSAWRWGWSATALAYAALFAVLVVVGAIDLRHSRIPDRITYPAAGIEALVVLGVAAWTGRAAPLGSAAVGGLLTWAGLGAAHLASPRGMGRGDVKLGLVLGIAVGWAAGDIGGAVGAVLALFLVACLVGTVAGLVLLVRRGRSEPYPFGPALIVGAVTVAVCAGQVTLG